MMSETAFFIKDVIGPKGSVSISDSPGGSSDDIEGHTKTGRLLVHFSALDARGQFEKKDLSIRSGGEPDHDGLCLLEQQFFLKAILEDLDLSDHLRDAVSSLQIVLAADTSVRTGKTILFE